MSGRYFGTDGIRGRANQFPMTAEVAMKVGMAAGMSFQRGNHRHRVVVPLPGDQLPLRHLTRIHDQC